MSVTQVLELGLVGMVVGAFGTLIGAGGGFLLMPLLLFLYPRDPPALLTGISLAVVCLNALSGSVAYARMGRVDFRSGLIFALAGLPGAVLGAWWTARLDRRVFDPLLGGVLVAGAAVVFVQAVRAMRPGAGPGTRRLVEADGTVHEYTPRVGLGAAVSAGVGVLSSLLGIGGGVIHVPAMVYLLGFPAHVATATSHFVLAILTAAGLLVHARSGTLAAGLGRALPLGAGALAGAQVGARLASRVQGRWILRALAVALALVGARLLLER